MALVQRHIVFKSIFSEEEYFFSKEYIEFVRPQIYDIIDRIAVAVLYFRLLKLRNIVGQRIA